MSYLLKCIKILEGVFCCQSAFLQLSIDEEEAIERDNEIKDIAGTRYTLTIPRYFCHADTHLASFSKHP